MEILADVQFPIWICEPIDGVCKKTLLESGMSLLYSHTLILCTH